MSHIVISVGVPPSPRLPPPPPALPPPLPPAPHHPPLPPAPPPRLHLYGSGIDCALHTSCLGWTHEASLEACWTHCERDELPPGCSRILREPHQQERCAFAIYTGTTCHLGGVMGCRTFVSAPSTTRIYGIQPAPQPPPSSPPLVPCPPPPTRAPSPPALPPRLVAPAPVAIQPAESAPAQPAPPTSPPGSPPTSTVTSVDTLRAAHEHAHTINRAIGFGVGIFLLLACLAFVCRARQAALKAQRARQDELRDGIDYPLEVRRDTSRRHADRVTSRVRAMAALSAARREDRDSPLIAALEIAQRWQWARAPAPKPMVYIVSDDPYSVQDGQGLELAPLGTPRRPHVETADEADVRNAWEAAIDQGVGAAPSAAGRAHAHLHDSRRSREMPTPARPPRPQGWLAPVAEDMEAGAFESDDLVQSPCTPLLLEQESEELGASLSRLRKSADEAMEEQFTREA